MEESNSLSMEGQSVEAILDAALQDEVFLNVCENMLGIELEDNGSPKLEEPKEKVMMAFVYMGWTLADQFFDVERNDLLGLIDRDKIEEYTMPSTG